MEGVNDKGPNASTLHTNETVCTMSDLTQKGYAWLQFNGLRD